MKILSIAFIFIGMMSLSSCNTDNPVKQTKIVFENIYNKENEEILSGLVDGNPQMKAFTLSQLERVYLSIKAHGMPEDHDIKIGRRFTVPVKPEYKSEFDGDSIHGMETKTIIGKGQKIEVVMIFCETKSGLQLSGLYSNEYYGE